MYNENIMYTVHSTANRNIFLDRQLPILLSVYGKTDLETQFVIEQNIIC